MVQEEAIVGRLKSGGSSKRRREEEAAPAQDEIGSRTAQTGHRGDGRRAHRGSEPRRTRTPVPRLRRHYGNVVRETTFGTSEEEGNRSCEGMAACSATMRLAIRAAVDVAGPQQFPASQLSGESAFGAASNARTARTTLTKVRPGSRPPSECPNRPRPSYREYSVKQRRRHSYYRRRERWRTPILSSSSKTPPSKAYPSGRRPTLSSSGGCPAAVPALGPAPSSAGRRRPLFSISCTSFLASMALWADRRLAECREKWQQKWQQS